MSRFKLEEKIKVIRYVLDEGHSMHEAATKFSVSRGEIQKWVAAYKQHGIAGIERQRINYTGEFKQAAVEDMRKNRLSYRETAAKYNVGDHKVVASWERIYLKEGAEGLYIERRGQSSAATGTKKGRSSKLDKQIEEDLIAENQRLRAEVDYLKKLNALVQERERRERKPK